mmetsp:Transcript_7753/g.16816  ORF Transcript_7753/g.16816 Transcript_7753/m.16816 type:complete len:80 (+) Transcript_7753:333-572(+)
MGRKNTALSSIISLSSISDAVTYPNTLFTATSKHASVTLFGTFHHIYSFKLKSIIAMPSVWIECLPVIHVFWGETYLEL